MTVIRVILAKEFLSWKLMATLMSYPMKFAVKSIETALNPGLPAPAIVLGDYQSLTEYKLKFYLGKAAG